MKKNYTKPMLYAECFQMVEHIAGSCTGGEYAAKHNTPWTCAVDVYTEDGGAERAFTNAVGACSSGASYSEDIMKMDGFMDQLMIGGQCYNVFTTSGGTMFSS